MHHAVAPWMLNYNAREYVIVGLESAQIASILLAWRPAFEENNETRGIGFLIFNSKRTSLMEVIITYIELQFISFHHHKIARTRVWFFAETLLSSGLRPLWLWLWLLWSSLLFYYSPIQRCRGRRSWRLVAAHRCGRRRQPDQSQWFALLAPNANSNSSLPQKMTKLRLPLFSTFCYHCCSLLPESNRWIRIQIADAPLARSQLTRPPHLHHHQQQQRKTSHRETKRMGTSARVSFGWQKQIPNRSIEWTTPWIELEMLNHGHHLAKAK